MRVRAWVAAAFAGTAVLLSQYPNNEPGARAFWLAVMALLYWRVLSGGTIALRIATVVAVAGFVISGLGAVALVSGSAQAARLAILTAVYAAESVLLWSVRRAQSPAQVSGA